MRVRYNTTNYIDKSITMQTGYKVLAFLLVLHSYGASPVRGGCQEVGSVPSIVHQTLQTGQKWAPEQIQAAAAPCCAVNPGMPNRMGKETGNRLEL